MQPDKEVVLGLALLILFFWTGIGAIIGLYLIASGYMKEQRQREEESFNRWVHYNEWVRAQGGQQR